jgi:hypothetical protein
MNFEEIVAVCLQEIEEGGSLESCLARYPAYAHRLEPMLRMALDLRRMPAPSLSERAFQQARQRLAAQAAVQHRPNPVQWRSPLPFLRRKASQPSEFYHNRLRQPTSVRKPTASPLAPRRNQWEFRSFSVASAIFLVFLFFSGYWVLRNNASLINGTIRTVDSAAPSNRVNLTSTPTFVASITPSLTPSTTLTTPLQPLMMENAETQPARLSPNATATLIPTPRYGQSTLPANPANPLAPIQGSSPGGDVYGSQLPADPASDQSAPSNDNEVQAQTATPTVEWMATASATTLVLTSTPTVIPIATATLTYTTTPTATSTMTEEATPIFETATSAPSATPTAPVPTAISTAISNTLPASTSTVQSWPGALPERIPTEERIVVTLPPPTPRPQTHSDATETPTPSHSDTD